MVLSSSWRVGEDIEDLRAYFESQGVAGELIDMTGIRDDSDREQEVLEWLAGHSPRPPFVVLDDDAWFTQLVDFHVQTTMQLGLIESCFDDVVRLFES